jgi:hypothetical protein
MPVWTAAVHRRLVQVMHAHRSLTPLTLLVTLLAACDPVDVDDPSLDAEEPAPGEHGSVEIPLDPATPDALVTMALPVAHWKLDDPGNTLQVADASGHGAVGTKYNGVGFTMDGRIGAAATFDGIDDRIEIADRPAFHFTNALSMTAWVSPTSVSGTQTIVNKWGTARLSLENGSYVFAVALANNQVVTVASAAPSSTWTHVVGLFDGATAQLWLNGSLVASSPAVGVAREWSQPVVIGNNPSAKAFAGRIDDVRLYDVALDRQAVQFMYVAHKKKVSVVRYDPFIAPNRRLSQELNWPHESARSQQLADKLEAITLGNVNYQIVEDVVIDAFPAKVEDNFRYTFTSYMECRNDYPNYTKCFKPDDASYPSMLADYQATTGTSLTDKINAGVVDEVWLWGGSYFGFDEFAFKVPNDQIAYQPVPDNEWIYGRRTRSLPSLNRTYVIMGFNPDRDLANAMHAYGHRVESLMTISPVARGRWHRCSPDSIWTQYICNGDVANAEIGCGDVHFPPNARPNDIPPYYGDYNYNSPTVVNSSCDVWHEYPAIAPRVQTPTSCSNWSGCTPGWEAAHEPYQTWWLSHIPKNPGNNMTEHYNWWRYIVDYDIVFQPLTPMSLEWSNAGPIAGKHCISLNEPADPHTWNDNYLCDNVDHGIRWSNAGPIAGMRCTLIDEPADSHSWDDNYLCVPPSSSLNLLWSYAGPIANKTCVHFHEQADPDTWMDNYLCH